MIDLVEDFVRQVGDHNLVEWWGRAIRRVHVYDYVYHTFGDFQ